MRVTVFLLYDSDCGFCRWLLAKVLAWDRRRRLRPLALQDPRADELLAGVPVDRRMASWHLVAPAGEPASGGAAGIAMLRLLPGGRPFAALLGLAPRAVDRAYGWVAGHRSALGRFVTAGAKRRADDRIARRRD